MDNKTSQITINGHNIKVINMFPGCSLKDIGNHIEFLIQNFSGSAQLRFMVIVNDMPSDITIHDSFSMNEVIRKMSGSFGYCRQAFVVKDPQNTAITMAYQNKVEIPNYHVQVFYTEDAALEWLAS